MSSLVLKQPKTHCTPNKSLAEKAIMAMTTVPSSLLKGWHFMQDKKHRQKSQLMVHYLSGGGAEPHHPALPLGVSY